MTDNKDLRITILIPQNIAKNARRLQSELILETGKSISFSSCATVLIGIGLKDIGQAKALIKKKYRD